MWMLRGTVIGVWTVSAGCAVPYLILYDTVVVPTVNDTMVFCVIAHEFNARAYRWVTVPARIRCVRLISSAGSIYIHVTSDANTADCTCDWDQ